MKTPISTLLAEKHTSIVSVTPKTTAKEAAHVMTDNHIRSVLVLDKGDLVGIFTERDVLQRIVIGDLDARVTLVGEVMTKELTTAPPSILVHEAMELINKTHHGHLPIVKDGELLGMISIGDITRYISHSFENEAGSLWSYITGDDPRAVLDFHEETV